MRNVLAVFDALHDGLRPLTRAEIETATGMVRDEVLKALATLKRRGILMVDGRERERARYSLLAGAARPQDQRGRFVRSAAHRQLKATLRLAALGRLCVLPAQYSAARPPTHYAAPSAIRTTGSGFRCLLAEALGYAARKR